MKQLKHTLLLLTLLLTAAAAQAKQKTVYVFGVSTSFNDSTVYITDIQEVHGAYIDDKAPHFLQGRQGYSDQLRQYLQNRDLPDRTCTTFWALKRKDLEKTYQKQLEKYQPAAPKKKKKQKNLARRIYELHLLATADFTYRAVEPDEGTVYVDAHEAEEAARKSSQKEKKGKHPTPPDGQMPQGAPGAGTPPAGAPQLPQQ